MHVWVQFFLNMFLIPFLTSLTSFHNISIFINLCINLGFKILIKYHDYVSDRKYGLQKI